MQGSPLEGEEREQALDVARQLDRFRPRTELEPAEKAQLRARPPGLAAGAA
jgi:hypothetical protein